MHNFLILSIFTFISSVYVAFQFPVFSTGDGGELAVASYTLGIAHPPGYPLYLQAIKLFSYIPIGNIPERMILASVLFSVLSLALLYRIVLLMVKDRMAALFSVLFLAFAYSYLGQSVVLKFYPLNLLIVASVLYLSLLIIYRGLDSRYVYAGAFLLGLSFANHHTGPFMLVPFYILVLTYGLKGFRHSLLSIPFLILGFSAHLYLFIRSMKENVFVFTDKIKSLSDFVFLFFRRGYEASSLGAVKVGIAPGEGFIYALKNLAILLEKNFTWAWLVFLILGFGLLLRWKSYRVILLFITYIFMYGIFLANITLGKPQPTFKDWYVIGHQYYLPLFLIVAVFPGLVLGTLYHKLRELNTQMLQYVLPFIAIIFPVVPLMERVYQQNFSKNYVPYSHVKATLMGMPYTGLYFAQGDNVNFQIWYLRTTFGFRRDVCSIEYIYQKNAKRIGIYFRGCKPVKAYKDIEENFVKGNFTAMAKEDKLYVTFTIDEILFLQKDRFETMPYLLYSKIFPKPLQTKNLENWKVNQVYNQKYMSLPEEDCTYHNSDDFYTLELCNFVAYNYRILADIYASYRGLMSTYTEDKSSPLLNYSGAQIGNLKVQEALKKFFLVGLLNDRAKAFYYPKYDD